MKRADIIQRLQEGPATNRELAELGADHGASISRTMAKLIDEGIARRIDGGSGRGSVALYALTENDNAN